MNERAFYILLAIALILAGVVGYVMHPCNCNSNPVSHEIKIDPAIAGASDSAAVAKGDSAAAAHGYR